jgi:hypothetical protein
MQKGALALLVSLSLLWAPIARCDTPSDEPARPYPPEYYTARRQMVTGILITSIGGGIGGALVFLGLLGLKMPCRPRESDECNATFHGLGLAAISAAVGVPQIVLGAAEKGRIRRDHEPSTQVGSTSLRLAYLNAQAPGLVLTKSF